MGRHHDNHDSLEFSRRIQEQRIVAEDRMDYDMLTPEQTDLEVIISCDLERWREFTLSLQEVFTKKIILI